MKAKIIRGDCLKVLRAMPDDSVDLVFTSPPYEDARTYGIDFRLKGEEYVDWCVVRYVECLRVCRGLVAWVINGRTRGFKWSPTPLLLFADLHRAGAKLRKPPIFHREGIPGSGGPDWLRDSYEFIITAASGKLPWSDNTAMGHPPKYAKGGEMSYRNKVGKRRNQWGASINLTRGAVKKNGTLEGGTRPSHYIPEDYDPPKLANPGNVIKRNVGGGCMGDDLAHENEAPFPESLAEFFVRSFCPPGGTVLDIFAGSGTTTAVALKNGRRSIAVDIRKSQTDIIKRRRAKVRAAMAGEKLVEA